MDRMTIQMEKVVGQINDFITPILVTVLIAVGLYLTWRTKFVQLRLFPQMFTALREGSTRKGEVSAFQAFCISAASRVGAANIGGVAVAIVVGGPGAIFWMWVVAFIGMATGFVESMLAQVYKVRQDGQFRGGPAYYIERALGKRWLGVIFAVLVSLTFGFVFNSFQSNTIAHALDEAFAFDPLAVGVVIAIATGIIIFGGVRWISTVSSIIVPVMATLYLLIVAYVLAINVTAIPEMFMLIVGDAFGLREAGVGIATGLLVGAKRGLFSNEAGMGSVPNAAAAADVSHPVKQGLVQSLGVFFDTMMICSATAFIILLTDVYQTTNLESVALTQASLSHFVGDWATVFIAIAIFFFAFSSIIGNYYYGETNLAFMTKSKIMLLIYRFCVVIMIVLGSVMGLNLVWSMADIFMAFTAIVNLVALLLLAQVAVSVLNDYQKQKKQGVRPVFRSKQVPEVKRTDCWEE
ncbi:alanine/glycine:cation symporter family protein [Shouchella lonarensis]|nr:alanine/glycine:cation symporter family protein [Shouchella lonarensis]